MIDSHQHFWHYTESEFSWIPDKLSGLRRDFLLSDLEHDLDMTGVNQVISVQSRCSEAENSFLLDQAKSSNNLIAGIVGWAPLTSDSPQTLPRPIHLASLI